MMVNEHSIFICAGDSKQRGKRVVSFSQFLSSRSPNGSTKKTRFFENDDQRRLIEDCPSFSLGIDFDSPVSRKNNDADNIIGMNMMAYLENFLLQGLLISAMRSNS